MLVCIAIDVRIWKWRFSVRLNRPESSQFPEGGPRKRPVRRR
jgi:hypothetical protein